MIDFHADTIYRLWHEATDQNLQENSLSVSVRGLEKIGAMAQCLAIYTPPQCTWSDMKAIHKRFVKEMEACYPAVDVRAELLKAKAWLINNPANRKTVGGMHRFIGNWLGREQNRAVRKEGMGVANTARDYTGQYKGDKFEVM